MITRATPLLLGSASPRRRELLETVRIPLHVAAVDVDEAVREGERPVEYLERVVASKLRAVAAAGVMGACAAALVADTTVVLDGEILGKPSTVDEAEAMVRRLVGATHSVLTRYAITRGADASAPVAVRTVSTRVTLRRASAGEIRRYAASGEGLDKAGAYAVQGIGALLVARIDGSYTNVVGLPLCEVVLDLRRSGLIGDLP